MRTIARIFASLAIYKRFAILQLSCAIGMTLMLLVFPAMTGRVQREVIEAHEIDKLPFFLGIVLASFFLRDLCNMWRIRINNTFEQQVVLDLRSALYDRIQRLPMRWFDERKTGDIMTRVGEDVPQMERLLIDGIEQGLIAIIQVVSVSLFLFYLSPLLALGALAPFPFLLIGAWLYTRHARQRYAQVREATSAMNALLHDNIAGISQIKSYAAEDTELSVFSKAANGVRQTTLKVMSAWALYSPSMSFLNSIGYTLVLGIGAWQITHNGLHASVLLEFFTIIWALYEPMGRLHQLNQMTQSSRAAATRVFAILDEPEEENSRQGDVLPTTIKGHVLFKNVSFSYDKKSILHDITMEALPGKTIALVGSTGSGKSTLLHLLARFYPLKKGKITIDGIDITRLHKSSLRAHIGYVTQEAFLFNGTVRENLLLGKRDASEESLWECLSAAHATDFVQALPEGLDSLIGERGVKLSVGQRQRLSIARALLKDPPILLLDEATASVDSQTEAIIQEALDKLMAHRTTLIIAHRLSTIQHADCIYVLEEGRLVEKGTHHCLLEKKGRYATLCSQSFLSDNEKRALPI